MQPQAIYKPKRYVGRCDPDNAAQIKQQLEQVLIEDWWNGHPDAGPSEPIQTPEQMLEKPTLSLAVWANGKPTIPEVALTKFAPTEEFYDSWTAMCRSFEKRVEEAAPADTTTGSQVTMTGPDFSHDPKPTSYGEKKLSVEGVRCAEFKHDDVCAQRLSVMCTSARAYTLRCVTNRRVLEHANVFGERVQHHALATADCHCRCNCGKRFCKRLLQTSCHAGCSSARLCVVSRG